MVNKTNRKISLVMSVFIAAILPIPVLSDMHTEEPPLIQFTNAHLTNLTSEIEYYGVALVGAKIYLGFENMGGSGTVTIFFNTIFGPDRSETYEIENAGRYDLFIHVGLGYSPLYNDELEVSSPNQIGNSKVYIFEETLIISIKEILLIPILPPPEVYYVDHRADGSGNGLNWENALQYVQTALQLAKFYEGSVHEIRVAQGTYQPDTVWSFGLLRNATFQLINGVEVKGGYAGVGSPDPNARDVNLFETILSGDRAGNDGPNFSNNDENSYQVVTGSGTNATTVLDGFTITGGNTFVNGGGGGLVNFESSSPTILNCKFTANKASFGGGVCNYVNCSPTLSDCTFSGNSSVNNGGGMYNSVNSSPTLTNCTFSSNSANYGGGMYNFDNSSPTLSECTFSDNSAVNNGGGMLNYTSNPNLSNCTFNVNTATYCGGMYNYVNSSPEVIECTFSGNSAEFAGGMGNYNSGPTLTNCTFSSNWAGTSGGGMTNNANSNPTVINCKFEDNSADVVGGGMFNYDLSSPTVTNCTFNSNSAPNGNALGCDSSQQQKPSNIEFTNCILWDGGNEIWNNDGSTITITYSDIQGGYVGTGNLDSDPCFVQLGCWVDANDPNIIVEPNDPNAIWVDGNYRLRPDSVCIDAGNNNEPNLTEMDIDGHPRIIDGDCNDTNVVDMGAYEFNYAYIGDFDYNCSVDFFDFSIFASTWFTEPADEQWNPFCNIGIPADSYIDWRDVAILCGNWLAGVEP